MHEIARHVRFCVNVAEPSPYDAEANGNPVARHNTFAAWPSMTGIGTYYELMIVCRGEPDPVTGYVMNAMDIDAVARQHALPIIDAAVRHSPESSPGVVLGACVSALQASSIGGQLDRVAWRLTPFYTVTMEARDMSHVLISQQFEFAAAHRLHCDELTAEENRRAFGKCNNPSGHGHNYRLETSVRVPIERLHGEKPFTLRDLEEVVDQGVIKHFDHTNLNTDIDAFRDRNPSVENIAEVIHGMLAPSIADRGASLHQVIVWETEKTWCAYPAPKR